MCKAKPRAAVAPVVIESDVLTVGFAHVGKSGASPPLPIIPLPALKWLPCCCAGHAVWTEGKPSTLLTPRATQDCVSDSSLGNTQNHSARLNIGSFAALPLPSVVLTYDFNSCRAYRGDVRGRTTGGQVVDRNWKICQAEAFPSQCLLLICVYLYGQWARLTYAASL